MKRRFQFLAYFLCLFLFSMIPVSVFGAGAPSEEPIWPNPGALQLSKTAVATGNPGEWTVTLQVDGKNVDSSSDVVLVIDSSGSMNSNIPTKLIKAKETANQFVDKLLLPESSSNRIAIVDFSKTASVISDFKGSEQRDELKDAIEQIDSTYGTNIQAGIKEARELLMTSSSANKVIIVLSDGNPTYSFKGTEASSYSWSNNDYPFAITEFNYDSLLGNSDKFNLPNDEVYEIDGYSVEDHGIATISEAQFVHNAGIRVFSVGIDVSANGNAMKVLQDIQNEGYYAGSSDDLNLIFQELAEKISYAAQEAIVIDPMGEMFNLKTKGDNIAPDDYIVSQGTVTWDEQTETFLWNVGTIVEGKPAAFSYTITIDPSKNPQPEVKYPTNMRTTIEYNNANQEKVIKDFIVPKVSIGETDPDLNRTLLVQYVDKKTGSPLKDPTEEKGEVGQEIHLFAQDMIDSVTGAVYKPHIYEKKYTFTKEWVQYFTFEYTPDEPLLGRNVTIHHLDKETLEPLIEPTVMKEIAGETLILIPDPISVTDAVYHPEHQKYEFELTFEQSQEFTIYYIKDDQGDPGIPPVEPAVKLHVSYLEWTTNKVLAEEERFEGRTGERIELTAKQIKGYTPHLKRDTYLFNEEPTQHHVFYYNRNSSHSGGSPGSPDHHTSTVTTPPAAPPIEPLPAVPPKLVTDQHYDYMNGYPDGLIKPLNNITREEVAAIFYRLLDDESRSNYMSTSHSFPDVSDTRWSNKYIATMEHAGVIIGYPDGSFKPAQYITRAEFATIASRFDQLDERENDMFSDMKGHWAEKYIASAANKGWINGYPDGTFRPNQYITRAETAAFINSVLNRKVDQNGLHEDANMWSDNLPGTWYYFEILEAANHHKYLNIENTGTEQWEEVLPNRIYP